jgi:hypothetical protein
MKVGQSREERLSGQRLERVNRDMCTNTALSRHRSKVVRAHRERPKSATLTVTGSLMRMFRAARSRWMMSRECRYLGSERVNDVNAVKRVTNSNSGDGEECSVSTFFA